MIDCSMAVNERPVPGKANLVQQPSLGPLPREHASARTSRKRKIWGGLNKSPNLVVVR